MYALMDYHLT